MSDKEIGARLTLDVDQANQSLKEFKQEMKVANAELREAIKHFGEMSPQAIAAAKRLAELKDAAKDAKETIDLFDPGAKFSAFANVLRGVAGGFSALTGTLALFGGESKEVEKTLLKVQAALALTEGLNTIADVAKDFERFNAVLKQTALFQKANAIATSIAAATMKLFGVAVNTTSTSFKVLKGAIAATGIGLLIVGIGELVNLFNNLTTATERAAEAQKQLQENREKFAEISLAAEEKSINRSEALYAARKKIRGASEQELFDNQQLFQRSRIESLKRYIDEVGEQSVKGLEAQQKLRDEEAKLEINALNFQVSVAEKQRDLDKKKLEEAKAASEKRREAEKSALEQLDQLEDANFLASIEEGRKRSIAEIEVQYENETKKTKALQISEETKAKILKELAIQRADKLAEVDAEIQKAQEEREKEALASLQKLKEDNLLASIENENERARARADIDFENRKKEIEELQVSEETKTALLAEAKITRAEVLAEIDAQLQAKQDELKIELDELEGNELQVKLARLDEWYKERLKIVAGNEELEIALKQSYESQKTELEKLSATQRLNNVAGVLGKAAELFGKQTAAGKVLAVAEATINTYTGMTTALREKSTLPQPFSTIQKIVSAGLILATGLKAIKSIVSTKVPGGGGGSTPSLSVSAAAPLSPQAQITTTQLDQQTLNNTNNATVRAYVNESDITNNQERITRLNRAARLGG